MSKYSCKCPAPGCGFSLRVEAGDDKEAATKMCTEGVRHITESHPDFPDINPERACAYVLKEMKKS
jgi:hypothetical protein